MFSVTHVGHNGWVVSTASSTLLVDPLLRDTFAATEAVGLAVHPPRRFDFDAAPPLDAVLLTHEHEDHFDLASIDMVDRSTPILMPSRSSPAMREILTDMGFSVRLTRPGRPVEIGADLSVLPMTADQVENGIVEEWDVLPFVVRDRDGHGNLFTHIDMAPTPSMWRSARSFVERPGLWVYTNNNTDWHFQARWARPDRFSLSSFVGSIVDYHTAMAHEWTAPEQLLVTGESFCFRGEQAFLNHEVFPWTNDEAARALALQLPGVTVRPSVPGETLILKNGEVAEVRPSSPFVRVAPRAAWPAREHRGDVAWLEDYRPASGREVLERSHVPALEAALAGLARSLHGGSLHRAICGLSVPDAAGRIPTFALSLRDGEQPLAFAYRPEHCSFVRVASPDPPKEFLAVYECWATDLLAMLTCRMSTTALCFGRSRMWNANPRAFAFEFNKPLFEYVHPLRRPDAYRERYRSIVAALHDDGPRLPGPRRSA